MATMDAEIAVLKSVNSRFNLMSGLAPQAGLEPATLRLTERLLTIQQVRRRVTKVKMISEIDTLSGVSLDRHRSS
jgi:hypothetical protein